MWSTFQVKANIGNGKKHCCPDFPYILIPYHSSALRGIPGVGGGACGNAAGWAHPECLIHMVWGGAWCLLSVAQGTLWDHRSKREQQSLCYMVSGAFTRSSSGWSPIFMKRISTSAHCVSFWTCDFTPQKAMKTSAQLTN